MKHIINIMRSIEKDNDIPNLPFSSRLNFCLDNKLIPFLNPVNTNNKDSNERNNNINNI